MELLKDALCLELRNLITVWVGISINPLTGVQHKEKVRRKLVHVCDQLDAIELGEEAERRGCGAK